MTEKTSLGSTKRYGTRYGPRNKEKVSILEQQHRGKHKCPFCNYEKVIRLSRGIWQCEKCNIKFAGKAYTFISKKKILEELQAQAEKVEEKEKTFDESNEAREEA